MPDDPKKPVDPGEPKGPQIDIGGLDLEDVPDEPAETEDDDPKWKRHKGGCGGPEVDD